MSILILSKEAELSTEKVMTGFIILVEKQSVIFMEI